jgi:two-component system nitrogen regulation response regulator GlnG/two-component system response regulator HydG
METIDLEELVDRLPDPAGKPRPGFALLWARDEPGRMGEVALIPKSHEGRVVVIGRAEAEPRDDLLVWQRQRPGGSDDRPGLSSPGISRTQLAVVAKGSSLEVENRGKGKLKVNGVEVEGSCQVQPGDVLEVTLRLVLLCVERPLKLPWQSEAAPSDHPFGQPDAFGLVGESPAAWKLREQVGFLARRNDHVLVRGDSGTGKELVAQALHQGSSRKKGTLVSRNAATIPATLVDAELFGNTKNYPNPGMQERPGLIGEASGSTLLLDEFAELPIEQQAHLLRVLDSGEYHRLGDSKARRADLRLIAATNRRDASFKEDVLARFKLRLAVPGLDERREDVPLLARHLLRSMTADDPELAGLVFGGQPPATSEPRLTSALVAALALHPYATHVRELETLLWEAIVRRQGEALDTWEGFPAKRGDLVPASAPAPGPATEAVDPASLDPAKIQACLDKHGGKQEPVWRELGLSSRHALTRLVKKHGLSVRGRTR